MHLFMQQTLLSLVALVCDTTGFTAAILVDACASDATTHLFMQQPCRSPVASVYGITGFAVTTLVYVSTSDATTHVFMQSPRSSLVASVSGTTTGFTTAMLVNVGASVVTTYLFMQSPRSFAGRFSLWHHGLHISNVGSRWRFGCYHAPCHAAALVSGRSSLWQYRLNNGNVGLCWRFGRNHTPLHAAAALGPLVASVYSTTRFTGATLEDAITHLFMQQPRSSLVASVAGTTTGFTAAIFWSVLALQMLPRTSSCSNRTRRLVASVSGNTGSTVATLVYVDASDATMLSSCSSRAFAGRFSLWHHWLHSSNAGLL